MMRRSRWVGEIPKRLVGAAFARRAPNSRFSFGTICGLMRTFNSDEILLWSYAFALSGWDISFVFLAPSRPPQLVVDAYDGQA